VYNNPNRAYIVKVPGILGSMAAHICKTRGIKYGAEVVGDPHDVFAPGSVNHILRPLLRKIFTYQLRIVVKNASSVLFVTKHQLQKRYPFSPKAFNTYAS